MTALQEARIAPRRDDAIWGRRALLSIVENPRPRTDYVIRLNQPFDDPELAADAMLLTARFVPDRHILMPKALQAYANAITTRHRYEPEQLAGVVFDDLNNELVPRWLNVKLEVGGSHTIVFEESQPSWENAALLSRLEHWS